MRRSLSSDRDIVKVGGSNNDVRYEGKRWIERIGEQPEVPNFVQPGWKRAMHPSLVRTNEIYRTFALRKNNVTYVRCRNAEI